MSINLLTASLLFLFGTILFLTILILVIYELRLVYILLLSVTQITVDIRHVWHVGCTCSKLLILLLHEHLMGLLDQWIILNILLIHVEVIVTILICWEIHILVLKIDNIQMVILIYNLTSLFLLGTL